MSKVSNKLRREVPNAAKNRCGYCLMPQEIIPMPLEIEHILPQAEGILSLSRGRVKLQAKHLAVVQR